MNLVVLINGDISSNSYALHSNNIIGHYDNISIHPYINVALTHKYIQHLI